MTRRARILTLLTYYHPHWTGLTTYAANIAEGLAERGHLVTVLTSQHERSLPRTEELAGVRVVRLPTVGRLSRAVVMPSFPRELNRLLAQHDVVHLHSPMPEAALVVRMARAADVPSLITHQGDVVMPAGAMNRVIQGAMDVTSTYAVRQADAVVSHSADYARRSRLLTRRRRPIDAIAPPTLIPRPRPAEVAAWREELGLTDRPVVGFAGRFVEEKGFDFLLEAIPRVQIDLPDVQFVFAGEVGVVYERFYERCRPLLDRYANAITSVGLLLDRQAMADFYAMCDVFALPSRTDCFAGVQVEALLCGTPVVAADIAGAREVVQRTGMGRLVRPRDPAALADGLVAELRAGRSQPERAAVVAVYDPAESIDGYEHLIDQLATRRRDAPMRDDRSTIVAPATTPSARSPGNVWPLGAADRTALASRLATETDMAYRRRVPRLVAFLDLRDGETVLDAGAGVGALSMTMRQLRDVRVVSLDADRVRLRWGTADEQPERPAAADLHALPFADASFDKVLAAEVLEHVDDDVAALEELRRVLRPGGVLAISVPHANYPFGWDPLGAARDSFGLPPKRHGLITGQWSGHQRLYLPAELRSAIECAGLDVEALEEQTPYAVPLNHLLVYSIGKPLVEHDLVPSSVRRSVSRFGHPSASDMKSPIVFGVRAMEVFDRRNEHLRGDESRFVGIVARAVKPRTC